MKFVSEHNKACAGESFFFLFCLCSYGVAMVVPSFLCAVGLSLATTKLCDTLGKRITPRGLEKLRNFLGGTGFGYGLERDFSSTRGKQKAPAWMSLQGEHRRWSKFFRSTRITLHAKLMRDIARVNVCAVEMAALGGFFAHATVRVCVCVRASFLPLAFDFFFTPPLLSLPPPPLHCILFLF